MNIRRATLEDIGALMEMGGGFVASCPNLYPAPERESTARSILASFHHTAPMVWLIAEEGGAIKGHAFAVASTWIWSQEVQSTIRFIDVVGGHGGGAAFLALLEAVDAWARGKGARECTFTLATGQNDERTAACLEKRGWVRTGVDLVKVMTPA